MSGTETVEELARELGIEAHERIPFSPHLIEGVVDGHVFRWQSRGETWSITLSDGNEIEISEGVRTPATDGAFALFRIVREIRFWDAPRTCPRDHHQPKDEVRFCSWCGSVLVDPLTWDTVVDEDGGLASNSSKDVSQ